MADYYPLIARAVDGLGASTGEARRALYERARAALVGQLRSIAPPLSEADITRERLALEDAVRKVEAETVRKARTERPAPPRPSPATPRPPVPPISPAPPQRERVSPAFNPALNPALGDPPASSRFEPRPQPRPDPRVETGRPMPPRPEPPALRAQSESAPEPEPPPSARNRLLSARTSPVMREGFKSFRGVVNEVDDLGAASARSAQSARDTRDSYALPPQQTSDDDEPQPHDRMEPRFDTDEADLLDDAAPDMKTLEPSFDMEDEQDEETPFARPRGPRAREQEEHYDSPRPPRSYRGLAKLAVVLIIIAGVTATVSWQWSNIMGLYQFVSQMRSRPTQTTQTPAAEPKFSERVPQEQAPGQAPAAGASTDQNAPAVAQRVVLYEEDPNNPQGRQYVGSAVWRTDTVSPGSGLAPELEVRADITIPDRNMTVTWTLRRNTDQALPASHTIEIMFNLPPDFPGGGIANVPGVLMKDSEQARGVPLAGLAVKVTNGFFLIGLSAVDADVQRNTQLLKEKPWFDIPIVYTNSGRAILALEKGPPGDRAFADAFAAWSK
jgi:hypothetical protein